MTILWLETSLRRSRSLNHPLKTKIVHRYVIGFLVLFLTLGAGGMGEGVHFDQTPSDFLPLNYCPLTDYQKLWHNCSLFKTSFDFN